MLELFVFNAVMRSGLFKQTDLVIAPLKSQDGDNLYLTELAKTFNIHNTQCFRDVDRQNIFGIVETAGDGYKGFDTAVRALAAAAAKEEMPPSEGDPSAGGGGSSGWWRAGGGVSQELLRCRGTKSTATPPPSPPSTKATQDSASEEDIETGVGEEAPGEEVIASA